MKYFMQFGIILAVTFLGEVMAHFIPLPVPTGVYGLILMLIGLITKIIPLRAVKETATFLLEIMPVMFIPAAVGISEKWDILAPVLLPVTVTMLVSTIVVMVASGHVTQTVIRAKSRKEAKKDESISL